MKTIEVDDEVFAFLQKHGFNLALRKLLEINGMATSAKPEVLTHTANEELDRRLPDNKKLVNNRSRAQQADLEVLARAGLVRNGEKLYLIDYKGNRVPKVQAVISGKHLIYNGRPYSMSKLAKEELAKIGFESKSARGPAHWVTEEGKSIRDLWQQYLGSNAKK
jgi:hypothetical protein